MELNEYQRLANQTDQQPEEGNLETDPRSIMVPLLGLAGEVGELLGEHKKWLRDGESYKLFPERVKEELGDVLWYLSNVATKHDLTLGEVADFNLSKIGRRWQPVGASTGQRKLFDEDFPPYERLPRQMDISIEEESGIAITTIDGAKYGDPLTDNRYEDDGYRFHDICHLSYASVLGWSPTMRALMRRKRKSDPKVDEVEDGGRAIVIEEGISAMVFSYAERRQLPGGRRRPQLRSPAHHQGHDVSPGSKRPHRGRMGAGDHDGVRHLAKGEGRWQGPDSRRSGAGED